MHHEWPRLRCCSDLSGSVEICLLSGGGFRSPEGGGFRGRGGGRGAPRGRGGRGGFGGGRGGFGAGKKVLVEPHRHEGMYYSYLTLLGPGYNWLFLTTFDFTIIFSFTLLVGCNFFQHNLTCLTVHFFFISTYCITTMHLKSHKT